MFKPILKGACALTIAVTLTGCGAGQISQMTAPGPTVNGTSGTAGQIALRNIHLHAVQTTAFLEFGREVDLVFTAVNNSPDVDDQLLTVTSEIGTVTLTGDTRVPADGILNVGSPQETMTALDAVPPNPAVTATVLLSSPITNGMTYDFTFAFHNNGQTTVLVPISAGATPPQHPNGGPGHDRA